MTRLFLLALALTNLAAFADEDASFKAAEKVCNNLYLGRDQTECLKAVSEASYLEIKAIKICGDQYLAKDTIACMVAIRDRRYSDEAVRACSDKYLAKNIIECFESSGRVFRGGGGGAGTSSGSIDKAYVVSSLEKAISLLRQGDDRKAQQLLQTVIDSIK